MEKRSHLEASTKSTSLFVEVEHFGENWCFEEAFLKQLSSIDKILEDENKTIILTGVHSSVYTLGNSFKNQTSAGLPENCVQTDRGGKIMYHGPGQLTIYPIFKLSPRFTGPKAYLKFMFDTCIDYFEKEHQIRLTCKSNGLWNEGDKKVGFVGLRVKKGITYHGLSLNYGADLSAFLKHSPCDISGEQAGNLFENSSSDLSKEAEALTAALIKGL